MSGSMLDNLKNRGVGGEKNFFGITPKLPLLKMPNPRKGDVAKIWVRVLPARKDMEYYYIPFRAHYQLGPMKRDAEICPRDAHDGECPLCEVIQDRFNENSEDKILRQIISPFWAKRKYVGHALMKDDPQVYVWIFGGAIEHDITALMIGEDKKEEEQDEDVEAVALPILGDVTSPGKGYWLQVRVAPGGSPNDYYKIAPAKKASPLATTKEEIIEILKKRIDLNDLIGLATKEPSALEKYVKSLTKQLDGALSSHGATRGSSGKRRKVGEAEGEDRSNLDDSDDDITM